MWKGPYQADFCVHWEAQLCHLPYRLRGQRKSNPADSFLCAPGMVSLHLEVLHTPLPSSSLQSLPSLTPFEFALKALCKASHKGFHNVFQQEPSKKKIPSFIIPAGESSVSVLYKTAVYHAQRVFAVH